jgi:hypothetical protein
MKSWSPYSYGTIVSNYTVIPTNHNIVTGLGSHYIPSSSTQSSAQKSSIDTQDSNNDRLWYEALYRQYVKITKIGLYSITQFRSYLKDWRYSGGWSCEASKTMVVNLRNPAPGIVVIEVIK